METHRLICHPDSPSQAVQSIAVELEAKGDGVWLRFHIDGSPDVLTLPDPAEPARRDGLWQTTCLEAFVMDSARAGYCEFNFSPSGEWAAYRFTSYRDGMAELALESVPAIALDASDSHFALEATIPLPSGEHRMALTAVIEEADGNKSYWALAHPPGKPDFHHPDCFVLHLPAPENT